MQYAVFPQDFPKISNISSMFLSKYTISKLYRNAYVHREEISSMGHFISFNLIYWTSMGGLYFLLSSNLEKCGKFWKNGRFSGRIWPDWGNTTRADLAGLGSIGLSYILQKTAFKYLNLNQNDSSRSEKLIKR